MLEILDLSNAKDWNIFLSMIPINNRDIYFTSDYYKIYEMNHEGKAECFVFEKNGDFALYPYLINSVNEIGYKLEREYYDIQGAYGYNGVISNCNDPVFIRAFYNSFDHYCRENSIIAEFTRYHPLINNDKFSYENLDIVYDRETVYLDLTKEYYNIWDTEYSSKNRNMIRKAEKNGVESFISKDQEDYQCFIDLYKETMKNVDASDYFFFDEEYFKNLREGLKGNLFLIVSKLKDEFVGGTILLIYGIFAHYHLSARNSEFGKYAISNHNLNYAIKFAKEQGCKIFHFGGGTSSDEKDPLLKFKVNFSTQKGKFSFGKKIHNIVYHEVVRQWEEKFPEKKEKYKNHILKYRF